MSTKRRESAKRILDPEGGYLCSCGCGKKPGKGRLYWHANAQRPDERNNKSR